MEYLGMTPLPRELEEGLLGLDIEALLGVCPGWLGASDKYLCVQRIARESSEAEIRSLLRKKPTPARNPKPEPKPEPKPAGRRRGRGGAWRRREGGTSRLTPGSARSKVFEVLPADGSPIEVEEIEAILGFDPHPHLAKLEVVGWSERMD